MVIVLFSIRYFVWFLVEKGREGLLAMHAFCSIVQSVEFAPKSRVFEIVGTVAKYYFDGMPSVQAFKRSIVQLIVHN